MDEKKEKGFVIKDKRLFDESGDVRKDESDKLADGVPVQDSTQTSEPEAGQDQDMHADQSYPEINFANFILSLSTSALYHFGDYPDPVSKKTEKNLPAAKQTIDILTMIRNKTTGNLDEGEKSLIEGLLYELQLRYVKETAGE